MRSIFLVAFCLTLSACAGEEIVLAGSSLGPDGQNDPCSTGTPGLDYAECDPIFNYHTGE